MHFKDLTINTNIGPLQASLTHFSHGHGGQNVNRHMKLVRLHADVTYDGEKKAITAVGTEGRSLEHNLEAAIKNFQDQVLQFTKEPTPRRPTRKTRASNERRLRSKEHTKKKKASRSLTAADF